REDGAGVRNVRRGAHRTAEGSRTRHPPRARTRPPRRAGAARRGDTATLRNGVWNVEFGMRRRGRRMTSRTLRIPALAALFALAACLAGAQTAAAGAGQKGKELSFKYSCFACHGYDGHGGPGARLVPLAMTVTRFTAYVHNPRRMPPYTDKVLTDAQLAD